MIKEFNLWWQVQELLRWNLITCSNGLLRAYVIEFLALILNLIQPFNSFSCHIIDPLGEIELISMRLI